MKPPRPLKLEVFIDKYILKIDTSQFITDIFYLNLLAQKENPMFAEMQESPDKL